VSKFENQKQNPRKSENQKIKKNLVLLSSRYELIRLWLPASAAIELAGVIFGLDDFPELGPKDGSGNADDAVGIWLKLSDAMSQSMCLSRPAIARRTFEMTARKL